MAKISPFLYGMIVCSLVAVTFTLFFGSLADSYSLDYDNESLSEYQQLTALNEQAIDIKAETSGIKEKTGILDIIGDYFSSAYKVLKLTTKSFDTFDTMSNKAIDQSNLGVWGSYAKLALGAAIIIFIFVTVIIAKLISDEV